MIETIARILSDHSVVLPTEIYNEGWMLRVTLDWYYQQAKLNSSSIFANGARWFSEGRLASQFLRRCQGDPLAEGYTHADGVIGHFKVKKRSEIQPRRDATQLIVIEAKLGSKLTEKVKNAPDYDQAARTVGCLAHIAGEAQISPKSLRGYGFYVVAPEKRVKEGVFKKLVTKKSVKEKVCNRVSQYGTDNKLTWYNNTFLPHLDAMDVDIFTWENLLDDMDSKGAGKEYREFYKKCCKYANL